MKPSWVTAIAVVVLMAFGPSAGADENLDEQRERMQQFVDGLNDNNFKTFHSLISERELTRRIAGAAMIHPQVMDSFGGSFDDSVQQFFVSGFPDTGGKEVIGKLIDFQIEGSNGRALVRYQLPGYRYVYHDYELLVDSRGRINIVDWIDYFSAYRFSNMAAINLLAAMPSDQAIRSLFSGVSLDNNQMFLAREIIKAYRDNQPDRFFEIINDFGPGHAVS